MTRDVRRRLRAVPALLLSATLVALALVVPQAAQAAEYRLKLDDFSGYADSAAVSSAYSRNPNGGQNTATLVPSPFGDGLGNALQLDYSYTNGYSGRSRTVDGYWPGLQSIELWVQHSAPGQDLLLQLSAGAPFELHLNSLAGYDAASTAPQHLSIPLTAFTPKTGSAVLDPSNITSFAVYINQVAGGTGGRIVLDEIELVFAEQPVLPTISLPSAPATADGVTNIISLLNDLAVVPEGARIVQASYTSSNPGVLPNFGRFVPKGDFLTEGTATVNVAQVKLFFQSRTFTLDVNSAIDVTVANLPAAVGVLDFLRAIKGEEHLSAMHHDQSYASNPDSLHQLVANGFGVYPAIYSADFLTGGTVPQRQNMINEVIRQWRNGNLVQIMFHVSPPQYTVAEEAQGNWGGDQAHETLPSPNRIFSYLYNDQWKQLMTDGTPLNQNWKLRMDEYARYLQQLEDAGVTVMLRPFHEMQQHVFWWGGRPGLDGSAGLYRMMHDYLENDKGLSNIVWVWNVQDLPTNYGWADGDAKFDRYEGLAGGLAEYEAADWNTFNPGKDYYDILSVDFYDPEGYAARHYEQAKSIAAADGGKPIQVGETFTFMTPAEHAAQPEWTSVMPWGARTWNYNTKEAMAIAYEGSLGASDTPRFSTLNKFPIDARVSVNTRCVGGKIQLQVTVQNTNSTPVTAAISSDFGSKSFTNVQPGKSAFQSYTTRLAVLPRAGVTVTLTGTVGGEVVSAKKAVTYNPITCG